MTRRLLLWLALSTLLIIICYYFVDRQVIEFAYHHQLRQYAFLDWFTYIPKIITYLALIYVVVFAYWKALGKQLQKWQYTLLLIGINVIITAQIKNVLKMVFGRSWPATWVNNNPSWLGDHVYGFHWFQDNAWYQSFPSGHTTVVFAAMSVIWFLYPKLRAYATIPCILVIVGLMGMYYHFVSDIIAGAYVGAAGGYICCRLWAGVKSDLLR